MFGSRMTPGMVSGPGMMGGMGGPSGSFWSRYNNMPQTMGQQPMQSSGMGMIAQNSPFRRIMQPMNNIGGSPVGAGMNAQMFHPQGDITAGMPAGNSYGGMAPTSVVPGTGGGGTPSLGGGMGAFPNSSTQGLWNRYANISDGTNNYNIGGGGGGFGNRPNVFF